MDLQKLFAEAKKLEVAKVQPSDDVGERKLDDRILYMKAGNTYRCRLVYRLTAGFDRKLPFINKEVHTAYGVEVPRGTQSWVVCPTTDYVKGRAGFRDCPICSDVSRWYKEFNTSEKSKMLYNTFKRKQADHAVVYVVSDPTNPENNGKMKIIKMNHDVSALLKWEIFGINLKDPNLLNEDAIGAKAFDFNDGYDVLFSVTKSNFPLPNGTVKDFDKPTASFTRRTSKIDVDDSEMQAMFEALKFDEDFYKKTPQPELLDWYNNIVLKNTVQTSSVNVVEAVEKEEVVQPKVTAPATASTPKKNTVVEQSVKQKPKPVVENVEEVDIDDIMNIIDGIGK